MKRSDTPEDVNQIISTLMRYGKEKEEGANKMESDDLSQGVLDYFHKIKTSEVMWCEDHDREFLEGEECPRCEEHGYESYG